MAGSEKRGQQEKLLPHNIEAECAVLGSILIEDEAFYRIADILTPDSFYRDAHRTIFEVMRRLLLEEGTSVDYVTLCDELEHLGKLDEVGGPAYVSSLIGTVPTSLNIKYYAQIVQRKATRRNLIKVAGQIATLAYEEAGDIEAVCQQAEELVFSATRGQMGVEFTYLPDYLRDYISDVDQMTLSSASEQWMKSGYHQLDSTTGGFMPGDLIIVAARPGCGKTAWAQNVALNACLAGKKGVFFTLEMKKKSLMDRWVGMESKIKVQHLRLGRLEPEECDALANAEERLDTVQLWMAEVPGIEVHRLCAAIRRMVAQHAIDFVVIDYLQLLTASVNGRRRDHREQEIAEIAQTLKNLANALDIVIITPAQINREIERSRVPWRDEKTGLEYKLGQLSDLRESGTIEQAADMVLFLSRAEGETVDRFAMLLVGKARNNAKGMFPLYFVGSIQRFYNLDDPEVAEEEARLAHLATLTS